MLPFSNVMNQLRNSFSKLTAKQQAQYAATIFGQEAMSGMLAIINASEQDYQKLANAVGNYNGAAKKMADTIAHKIHFFKVLHVCSYYFVFEAVQNFVYEK